MSNINFIRQGEYNRNVIAQFLIKRRGVKYSVRTISDEIGLNKASVRTHCHQLTRENPEINLKALRVEGVMRKVDHFFAI